MLRAFLNLALPSLPTGRSTAIRVQSWPSAFSHSDTLI